MRSSLESTAIIILLTIVLAVSHNLLAQVVPTTTASSPGGSSDLVFNDPSTSSAARVGGGTRGEGDQNIAHVFLLVSVKPGKTINPRPVIYWYLSDNTDADVDLVISEPGATAPLFRQTHTGMLEKGLHSFTLEEKTAELKAGVLYKVTVTLWANTADPSLNPFSTGFLERVAAPTDLAGNSPRDFAAAGLWYDALDALGRRIQADPADAVARAQRLNLLRQQHVFLSFAAEPKWEKIRGVPAAEADAQRKEQLLLEALAAADQAQLSAPVK